MSKYGLVNTRYFREAALDFKKNGGQYTLAPVGSREYREYWEMHEKRCQEGYSVGGTWVTGRHYWFLNFTPIKKIADANLFRMIQEARDKHGRISEKTADKIIELPRFTEVGFEWYRLKHIAWNGGRFDNVVCEGGKHMVGAKSRGAGMSYMEASDGCYNYNFIPGSISYYLAGKQAYLDTDGILNKAKDMLDWINMHIPFWSQNRAEKDTTMHMKASYKDAFGVPRGSLAEIIGVVVDDPEKTRGKRGIKVVFEEGGSFKNLLKALNTMKGSMKDGSFWIGQMSVFGTGGEEGPGIEGLETLFDDPATYDFLAVPNTYDEDAIAGETCGIFIGADRVDPMFADEDGNVDRESSLAKQEEDRAQLSKSTKTNAVDIHKAEYPIKPSEVFQRMGKNPFPKAMIDTQIAYLLKSTAAQELIRYGDLIPAPPDEGGWQFVIKTKADAKPIDHYPHADKDDLEGCISVVEQPWKDQLGHTPSEMYQLVFDPFYSDQADDQTSLFDATVWKNFNPWSAVNEEQPIAWYVGRPQNINDAIERTFRLAMWYNCKINGEIAGGGQAVLDYARAHHLLHLLDYDLEITDNHEVTEKRNQRYLTTMPAEKKRMGLTYFIDWTKRQRGIREDGTPIYNVQRCFKLRLLRECVKFDGKRNADSISNAIMAMFSLKEKQAKIASRRDEDKEDFYERELFTGYGPEEREFVEKY